MFSVLPRQIVLLVLLAYLTHLYNSEGRMRLEETTKEPRENVPRSKSDTEGSSHAHPHHHTSHPNNTRCNDTRSVGIIIPITLVALTLIALMLMNQIRA